ncbi:MAG TPA: hypothetical protein VFV86_12380 [Nitrososphaeraceae archaeon]|nr:hypothetical protein [Nitrososphaeraceae archaeon]
MRKVSIIGGKTSEFRKDTEINVSHLALESTIPLLRETGFPRDLIDAVIVSSCSIDQYLSSIIAELLGIKPKISHKIDNLCNSGTNAIISGFSYIASGLCDSALIIGVEKANTLGKVLVNDLSRGQFTLPIYWGSIFKKIHMNKYGTKDEQICSVPVNNYFRAKNNKTAYNKNKSISLEDVLNSRIIIEPLKLLECCSICEGSSSLLLVAEEKIPFFKSKILSNTKKGNEVIPVLLKGIGQQTNSASFSNSIKDIFELGPAKIAARQAYKMAKSSPTEMDVVEIHDAFSILEIMGYEDLEFAKKGEGGNFVNQNNLDINPRGGIIGCGHPIGVTGIAQTVSVVEYITGKHNVKLQDSKKSIHCKGIVHNLAAAGTSATVLIIEN